MQNSIRMVAISIAFIVFIFIISLATPTIASAMTKEEIFNQIESLQKKSTENQINVSIDKLLQTNTTDNKNQLVVNIQDFGAKGNGVDSDVDALNKAIESVNAKGGGSIFFPATSETYVLDKLVSIPKDVNLMGEQTRISRYFNYKVSSSAFNFRGNNIMAGFIYDGGLTRIPDIGDVQNEPSNYHEFSIYDGGCVFYNNVFLNAKGSFIGGNGSNTIVYNNTFGEYGDHCIYVGGNAGEVKNLIISNNSFTALTSTRDAVLISNSGEMVIVSNNTFDLPKGRLFTFFKSGDPMYVGNLDNISFSYNTVKNCKDIGLIGRGLSPIGSTLGNLNNIKISNNMIEACKGYFTIGGSLWSAGTNYDNFSGTNIDISNNTFNQTPEIHLCNSGDGLKVNITNNKAYGRPLNYSLVRMYGNTSLDLSNNIFGFDNNTSLIKSPYQQTDYTSETAGIKATKPQEINISGNTITGLYKIFLEDSNKNTTYLNDKIDFIVANNTFTNSGSAVGTDATGVQS